jgi:hypothetical protein
MHHQACLLSHNYWTVKFTVYMTFLTRLFFSWIPWILVCLKHVLLIPSLFDTSGYVLPSPIQQLPTILTFQKLLSLYMLAWKFW